jgi:hypothetical protein
MADTESNHSDARATIWLSKQLKGRIKDQLGYEDAMSAWVRRACQDRLLIDAELERAGIEIPDDERERERLVRDLIVAGIDDHDTDA